VAVLLLATGWMALGPLWPVPKVTLAEAVVLSDYGTVLQLVSEGHDPNLPSRIRRGLLGPRDVVALPLEAAVANRRPDMLKYLLSRGARMDDVLRMRLACLASERGAERTVQFLLEADAGAHRELACDGVRVPW